MSKLFKMFSPRGFECVRSCMMLDILKVDGLY